MKNQILQIVKWDGIPYVKLNEEVPKDKNGNDMALFIQINFEQMELENYPKSGMLQLFVDKELSYPVDYKVIYIENVDEEYRKDINFTEFVAVSNEFKIDLLPAVTHMPINDFRFNEIICEIINEEFGANIMKWYDIEEFVNGGEDIIYDSMEVKPGLIGGYADFTQSDPRESELEEDYTECLIKIDSNLAEDKIFIGDAGIAWLLIREEDLKQKKFENAKFDWDCY